MSEKFSSLLEFTERFPTEKACRDYYIQTQLKGVVKCPDCWSEHIYEYKSRPIYKCKACYRQFRLTTGTIFEGTSLSLRKWFLAIYLITDTRNISSIELGRKLKVSQKCAWNIAHKIRYAMSNTSFKKMDGITEMDESYYGGKRKGKRGRGALGKIPIFGMLERGVKVKLYVVKDTKRKTLEPLIYLHVKKGAQVMSDEWWAYTNLDKNYVHGVVKHKIKEYVRGNIHVNSLEGLWNLLKNSMKVVHVRPTHKYLSSYCDEFEFKYNNRQHSFEVRFNKVLSQANVRVRNGELAK